MKCLAACCNMLQCVAVCSFADIDQVGAGNKHPNKMCCSTLQYVAVCEEDTRGCSCWVE